MTSKTRKMVVIAVTNNKGGVGKTTSALNLAAALAARGHRVLLGDLDMQANTTSAMFPRGFRQHTIGDWLLGSSAARDVIRPVPDVAPGTAGAEQLPLHLHLLPATTDLADQELQLLAQPDYQLLLRKQLSKVASHYDYTVLDCPPSMGVMTYMAFCAADRYVVPCEAEKFSFDGVKLVERLALSIQKSHNPKLLLAGLFFTKYNPRMRRRLNHEVVLATEMHFGSDKILPHIRQDVALAEAQTRGICTLRYNPGCNGVADYAELATSILETL